MATIGAVLTGGASRRMGRQKALIDLDGVPMAAVVVDALLRGGCDDVVLIGGDPTELAPIGRPVIADLHPGAGPLGAVITALAHAAEGDDVVVVACDLPFVGADSIAALIAAATDPLPDVIVARTSRVEPACALWRTTRRQNVERLFAAGTRSLREALANLVTVEVSLPEAAFLNVNRPGDVPGQ